MSTAGTLAELAGVDLELAGDPLAAQRRRARTQVARTGFPTTREEDWRYLQLRDLLATPFDLERDPLDSELGAIDALLAEVPDLGGPRLVLVNGRFAASRSRLGPLPQGARLASLDAALREEPARLAPLLEGAEERHAFRALSEAFSVDGALVELEAGVRVAEPVQLVHLVLARDSTPLVSPRSVVRLAPGAQLELVELFVGPATRYFVNATMELRLAADAQLDHVKVQFEGGAAFHLSSCDVVQESSSVLRSRYFALGGAIARNEITVRLEGEGASAELDGLFVPGAGQQHDNPTTVIHSAANCTSRQYYKGVVDAHGHGIFNGRVVVRPGAIGTDAGQVNKNLLLAETAEVDTRPRLEIFADDVKVAHGAAVGQLDEEALFYLRSRGIHESAARSMLVAAFAGEMLDRVENPALRARLVELLARRRHGGAS